MTSTLDDLREVLAARAATTSFDDAAARARLDARLARRPSRTRRTRPLLVAAVAALVLGVVSATVLAAVYRSPATAPPAAGPHLPLTDYLFDLDEPTLTAAGLSTWFGGVDARSQRAFVEPAGSPPNTAYSATVLVGYDATALGVAIRPADATDVRVGSVSGWTAPHRRDTDDLAYGLDGVLTTWTDSSGLTVRVVAVDQATLTTVTAAVRLGQTHPVLFPAALAPDALPEGSHLTAVEADPDQGASLTFTRPGAPDLEVIVDRPGVNVSASASLEPFVNGFSLCVPRLHSVDLLTDRARDLEINTGQADSRGGDPLMSLADLRRLVAGMRFADVVSPSTWFPMATAVPAG